MMRMNRTTIAAIATSTTEYYCIRITLVLLLLLLLPHNSRHIFLAAEIQGPDASAHTHQWRRDANEGEVASSIEEMTPTTASPEIVDLKIVTPQGKSNTKPTHVSTTMEERSFSRMTVEVELEGIESSEAMAASARSQSKQDEGDIESSSEKLQQLQQNNNLQMTILERVLNNELLKMIRMLKKLSTQKRENPNIVKEPTYVDPDAQLMYDNAKEILSTPNSDRSSAYTLFQDAAGRKHSKARAEVAWGHALGHYLDYDIMYAVTEFDELVQDGLPEAHLGLAYLHALGVGGKNVSQSLVLLHLTFAAMGENTFAQIALGYRYLFGINVQPSCEKALSYYQRVARKVKAKVKYSPGPFVHRLRLIDEAENPTGQEAEIIDYYQLLADKGDVQSQVGLGQLYYQGGKVVQQDHKKAFDYFTRAANSGNAVGYAFLGKLYLEGTKYVKADNATALKYFAKAATMGDPVGQSGLGLMYLKGLGVPRDPVKALNYFTMAADQGWVEGQLQLGNMYFLGDGVKPDYILALKYFTLASQSGHILAYYNLGVMHSNGMGILRSCPTAVEFFKHVAERDRWSSMLMNAYSDYKAGRFDEAFMQYAFMAELGMEIAQSNAAYLLENHPVLVFRDRNEELIRAFYYWKRAAAQDYSAAQVKLGDYYYYGLGTDVDFETAASLYRKASDQQYNAQAMFNLGYMHEKGLGMKKDWHLAKRLYDLAAKTNADAKIPVAIALFKLQLMAKIEALKESPYRILFFLDENFPANWNLYSTAILTLLLGILGFLRQQNERRIEQLQTEIDNLETFLQQINTTDSNEEGNNIEPGRGGGSISSPSDSDPSNAVRSSQENSGGLSTASTLSTTSPTTGACISATTTTTTSSSSMSRTTPTFSRVTSATRHRNVTRSLDRAAIASTADPIDE